VLFVIEGQRSEALHRRRLALGESDRIADGITARVFGVLNELAIDAVETGTECISDTRHRNLEARNRKGGRFCLTALQNWHSN
jgi:hypothetical protein